MGFSASFGMERGAPAAVPASSDRYPVIPLSRLSRPWRLRDGSNKTQLTAKWDAHRE